MGTKLKRYYQSNYHYKTYTQDITFHTERIHNITIKLTNHRDKAYNNYIFITRNESKYQKQNCRNLIKIYEKVTHKYILPFFTFFVESCRFRNFLILGLETSLFTGIVADDF